MKNEFYVKYPFPLMIYIPERLGQAFPTTKLPAQVLSGMLFGFVMGAKYKELAKAKYSAEKKVQSFPKGEWEPATREINPTTEYSVSEVSIRNHFKKWRQLIFTDQDYCNKIFYASLEGANLENPTFIARCSQDYEAVAEILSEYGLYSNLKQGKLAKRMLFWERLKECMYECPYGLSLAKFKKKTNGHTKYQIALTNWRIFLGEIDGKNGFQSLYRPNQIECQRSQQYIAEQIDRKSKCRTCKTSVINRLSNDVLQCTFSLLARYPSKSTRQFCENFLHCLLVALIRRKVIMHIGEINRVSSRWLILPERSQKNSINKIYELDRLYQKNVGYVVNEIVDTMCVARIKNQKL